MPRMMKTENASAKVTYGKISPAGTLSSPRSFCISKIAITAVTRVGKNIDATSSANTSVMPGVRRKTIAYPAITAQTVVMTIVPDVTTMLFR